MVASNMGVHMESLVAVASDVSGNGKCNFDSIFLDRHGVH